MSNKFTFNRKEKAHHNTVIQTWGGAGAPSYKDKLSFKYSCIETSHFITKVCVFFPPHF